MDIPFNYKSEKQSHYLPGSVGIFFVLLGMLVFPTYATADIEASEANIRTAFIHRILQYTQWDNANSDTLSLCAVGSEQDFQSLKLLDRRKITSDTEIAVSEYSESVAVECHVVIVGTDKKMDPLLLPNSALLICNGCEINREKAAVDLIRINDQIRYNVNIQLASQSGVKFRSDVLKWANKVVGLHE